MAFMSWQIGTGGVLLPAPSLSGTRSAYGQRSAAKSRPALANVFSLRPLSRSPERILSSSRPGPSFDVAASPSGSVDTIILKSADDANFRVSKHVLGQVSSIFRRLFSDGTPQSLHSPEPRRESSRTGVVCFSKEVSTDGLFIVQLTEDGKTLDALLHLLYHGISLPPENRSQSRRSIDDIKPVLLSALKYDMSSIADDLLASIQSDLSLPMADETDTFALRLYALACDLRRPKLAQLAAYASLRGQISEAYFPELETLPSIHYFHLLKYHHQASVAICNFFHPTDGSRGISLPAPYADLIRCSSCSRTFGRNMTAMAAWWECYVSRAADVVREAPRSQLIFSSEFMADMFEEAERCKGDCRVHVHARWLALSLILKDMIERTLSKIKLG
ncbi:hypothetical protein EW145_g6628 [Phellinidium pouzarii]|uniref:BTB domain-containing protein n=1 Tax=Phellinidium pouzarii TaxID=167371 RepID=A0A4S4KVY6_9AGAM|nr:hypothetical protein EW145_g6628 [Phellinidium pouzarii]